MSQPEEEDSILQKSVIPNLLEEEFHPPVLTETGDVVIPRENQNIENLIQNHEENADNINEVTSYKRKQFKAGVDFRKTLGSSCKINLIN